MKLNIERTISCDLSMSPEELQKIYRLMFRISYLALNDRLDLDKEDWDIITKVDGLVSKSELYDSLILQGSNDWIDDLKKSVKPSEEKVEE